MVLLWQKGPMQTRVQMMDGMVAVVEAKIVKRPTGEVPCEVEPRSHVTSVVLEKIQREDTVFGVELREQREPKPATPI